MFGSPFYLPKEPGKTLTYTGCCKASWVISFFAFNNLYFSRKGLLNMLALSPTQPASHMYRFTCSHQGAARLTQSCFSSIWPPCSSTGAAGGLLLVQGHLRGRWGRRGVLLICLPYPDFPRHTVYSNWRPSGHEPARRTFLFSCCPSVVNGIHSIATDSDLLPNKLSF